MKIVIIGGHLAPALSVIEKLPKDAEILYIGRKHGLEGDSAISLEYQTITEKEIPFVDLKTGRLQRKPTKYTLTSLGKIPRGIIQSLKILRKFRPDVVVGFGGYVSFPVILAARLLKIPVVIHEQTLEAGATNKAVAKFAEKICISFSSSEKFFPKEKTVLTGNPIRNAILVPSKSFVPPSSGKIIYVTGGSLGAHAINILVEETISKLVEKYIVVHQTGAASEFNDFDRLQVLKDELDKNRGKYIISKFFSPEEVGGILKASDLVISRAGINSVSELIILKKPALLIPLPVSQKNEQVKNAAFFEETGLGKVTPQSKLIPDSFLSEIEKMMGSIGNYKLKVPKKDFPENAAEKIVEVIYEIRKNSN